MKVPFAALRRCPGRGRDGGEPCVTGRKDNGSTDISAPVSTKKEHLEDSSNTDIDPADTELREMVPGAIDARRWRFPEVKKTVAWQ